MQKEQQNYLSTQLATLDSNERRKLYKRATAMRKLLQGRRKPEEDESHRRSKSLDDFVLQILQEEEREAGLTRATGSGLVVWLGPKSCRVKTESETVECSIPRTLSTAIGDRVTWGPHGEGHALVSVKPRTTVLSRPDSFNKHVERVIVANIDAVVVVVSVIAPPLHPRIIDRYMVAIQRGGARMVLAVNKTDLLDDFNREAELEKLEPYKNLFKIVMCSTANGSGVEEIRETLTGQTCAFVGHSGVGKSSLINAFEPGLNLSTGDVSDGYGRGTHTTTSSTLHELSGGTKLIDTPGIRSFGLWDITPEDLAWYFPEFEEYRSECKFRDCSHSHEPNCGVKVAVAKGDLSRARYDTYMRILTFG